VNDSREIKLRGFWAVALVLVPLLAGYMLIFHTVYELIFG